jgi:predicted  nucleic acid-binding Zn-ribbon protein
MKLCFSLNIFLFIGFSVTEVQAQEEKKEQPAPTPQKVEPATPAPTTPAQPKQQEPVKQPVPVEQKKPEAAKPAPKPIATPTDPQQKPYQQQKIKVDSANRSVQNRIYGNNVDTSRYQHRVEPQKTPEQLEAERLQRVAAKQEAQQNAWQRERQEQKEMYGFSDKDGKYQGETDQIQVPDQQVVKRRKFASEFSFQGVESELGRAEASLQVCRQTIAAAEKLLTEARGRVSARAGAAGSVQELISEVEERLQKTRKKEAELLKEIERAKKMLYVE